MGIIIILKKGNQLIKIQVNINIRIQHQIIIAIIKKLSMQYHFLINNNLIIIL